MTHPSNREIGRDQTAHDEPSELDRRLHELLLETMATDSLPEFDSPLARLAHEFFRNTWEECRDGLLKRTTKIRVIPEPVPAPRMFLFEVDCPYKRKLPTDAAPVLMPGPVRGQLLYRSDLFESPQPPTVMVMLDPSLGYFHPNFGRRQSCLCLGDERNLPPGPLPLETLLENHVYPVITYQNRRPSHPADLEAARYFALDPTAMCGLEPVEPLY